MSTEHGLEQDFNSLDAQYDAAQAYIRSQAHAGWTLIRSRYADGGYSGGSTERPVDASPLLAHVLNERSKAWSKTIALIRQYCRQIPRERLP